MIMTDSEVYAIVKSSILETIVQEYIKSLNSLVTHFAREIQKLSRLLNTCFILCSKNTLSDFHNKLLSDKGVVLLYKAKESKERLSEIIGTLSLPQQNWKLTLKDTLDADEGCIILTKWEFPLISISSLTYQCFLGLLLTWTKDKEEVEMYLSLNSRPGSDIRITAVPFVKLLDERLGTRILQELPRLPITETHDYLLTIAEARKGYKFHTLNLWTFFKQFVNPQVRLLETADFSFLFLTNQEIYSKIMSKYRVIEG